MIARYRSSRFWYALLAMFVSFLLGLGATFLYVNQVDRQSDEDNAANDRKWCKLLIILDDAYLSSPPPPGAGQQVAEAVHALRFDLGC